MAIEKNFLKSRPVCKVKFTLEAEEAQGAKSVSVVGEFNDWDVVAHQMKPNKDGSFSLIIEMPAQQEYRFRYLLDGKRWVNETVADGYEYCAFAHTENSLLRL